MLAHTAATAPTFSVGAGWGFTGWDSTFDSVTTTRTITARYEVPTFPVLVTPPESHGVSWLRSTSLTVSATGTGPLTYQWYRGDSGDTAAAVPGATGPLLVTPSLTAITRFWVRVTNAGFLTYGPAATVSVGPVVSLALGAAGENFFGQLGDGSQTDRYAPFKPPPPRVVRTPYSLKPTAPSGPRVPTSTTGLATPIVST